MYGKLLNVLKEEELGVVSDINDLYDTLYHEYTTLQDLNTVDRGRGPEIMEDVDYQNIKNQVASGVSFVDAFMSVLPVGMVTNAKRVLEKYKGDVEEIFNKSKNISQFVSALDTDLPGIIKGEYQGKEFTLKDLSKDIENGGI